MPDYALPKIWEDYLMHKPETGMGYHLCDIYFSDKILIDAGIMNCNLFHCDEPDLNLNDILNIEVKPRQKKSITTVVQRP